MNIALVTNKKLHHKYWAYSMYKKHDVKIILHPHGKKNIIDRIRNKNLFKYGLFYFILKVLSIIYNKIMPKSMLRQIEEYEKKYFIEYGQKYEEIPKQIIHDVETVNDIEVIKLLKKNDIDIICF